MSHDNDPYMTFDLHLMAKNVISQKMLLLPQIKCNDLVLYACDLTYDNASNLYFS